MVNLYLTRKRRAFTMSGFRLKRRLSLLTFYEFCGLPQIFICILRLFSPSLCCWRLDHLFSSAGLQPRYRKRILSFRGRGGFGKGFRKKGCLQVCSKTAWLVIGFCSKVLNPKNFSFEICCCLRDYFQVINELCHYDNSLSRCRLTVYVSTEP